MNFNDPGGQFAANPDAGPYYGNCSGVDSVAVYVDGVFWGCNGGAGGEGGGSGGGACILIGDPFAPAAPNPGCYAPVGYPEEDEGYQPTCEEQLINTITDFLAHKKPSLAKYAGLMEAVGASDNLDPRLFAAIAVGENGSARNNPYALGRNGSSTFGSITDATARLGSTLDKYVYQWKETSVSALWSGNTWIVDPEKKWITIQYPGYCVGTDAASNAACQNTGNTIATFMKSMSADPNKLGFPCND